MLFRSEESEKKAYTTLYDEPFVVEVPVKNVKQGAANTLVVRVHNQVGAGGLWRPVHALLSDSKK